MAVYLGLSLGCRRGQIILGPRFAFSIRFLTEEAKEFCNSFCWSFGWMAIEELLRLKGIGRCEIVDI